MPAAAATTAIAVALGLGLRTPTRGSTRVHAAARLIGEAVRDAFALLRTRDARLAGALAWWAFDAAVLGAMLQAFGGAPSPLVFVFAYFVGQAGNTVPIPGAVSGGIVGVLLAFGVDADTAIVSVLGYRSVAIWLPAPIGLVALTSLRRTLARWGTAPQPVAAERSLYAPGGELRPTDEGSTAPVHFVRGCYGASAAIHRMTGAIRGVQADDGLRTRDLRLGKPTLYQLSYVRELESA